MSSNSLIWRWLSLSLSLSRWLNLGFLILKIRKNFEIWIRGIVGYGKWEVQEYWLIQSWWGIWILESLGYTMLQRSSSRISRYCQKSKSFMFFFFNKNNWYYYSLVMAWVFAYQCSSKIFPKSTVYWLHKALMITAIWKLSTLFLRSSQISKLSPLLMLNSSWILSSLMWARFYYFILIYDQETCQVDMD